MADHLKQSGAHIVVKVLGEKLFLSRSRESGTDVRGEFVSGIGGNRVDKHFLIPPIIGLHISRLHSGNQRTHIGSGPGTSCETWAGACMRPCAPSLPSSRSACRRRNQPSTLGKTEKAQNRETAQTRWTSIPTHSPGCRRCRKRSGPQETRSPVWGPSGENRNCRSWGRELRFPMDMDKGKFFRIRLRRRTRRDATPLR